MPDLIPQVADAAKTFVVATETVAPEIKAALAPAFDVAATAATQIAQAEGVKDPEAASQKILMLESRVQDLEGKFSGAMNALALALDNAKSENAQQIAASLAPVAEALGVSQSRISQIESAIPDIVAAKESAEKLIADFEAELPSDWKNNIKNLLLMGKQHFGL
jgi:hypothetical protein